MLNKMKIQINILICIIASIWGIIFANAHQIYSTIVRPVLAYRTAIWHSP